MMNASNTSTTLTAENNNNLSNYCPPSSYSNPPPTNHNLPGNVHLNYINANNNNYNNNIINNNNNNNNDNDNSKNINNNHQHQQNTKSQMKNQGGGLMLMMEWKETRKVAKFIRILREIVSPFNESRYGKIIKWSESGMQIIIFNSELFCSSILPQYFNHRNFSSFVHQLNCYGFRKLKHTSSSSSLLQSDFHTSKHQMLSSSSSSLSSSLCRSPSLIYHELSKEGSYHYFEHPYFQRDNPSFLNLIIRRSNHQMFNRQITPHYLPQYLPPSSPSSSPPLSSPPISTHPSLPPSSLPKSVPSLPSSIDQLHHSHHHHHHHNDITTHRPTFVNNNNFYNNGDAYNQRHHYHYHPPPYDYYYNNNNNCMNDQQRMNHVSQFESSQQMHRYYNNEPYSPIISLNQTPNIADRYREFVNDGSCNYNSSIHSDRRYHSISGGFGGRGSNTDYKFHNINYNPNMMITSHRQSTTNDDDNNNKNNNNQEIGDNHHHNNNNHKCNIINIDGGDDDKNCINNSRISTKIVIISGNEMNVESTLKESYSAPQSSHISDNDTMSHTNIIEHQCNYDHSETASYGGSVYLYQHQSSTSSSSSLETRRGIKIDDLIHPQNQSVDDNNERSSTQFEKQSGNNDLQWKSPLLPVLPPISSILNI